MKQILLLLMLALIFTGCKKDKATVEGAPGKDGKDGASLTLIEEGDGVVIQSSDGETVKVYDGKDGSQGDKGDKGDPGPQGAKGDKGDKGADGINGQAGVQGPRGSDGKDGRDGKDGLSSLMFTERVDGCAYFYVGLDLDHNGQLDESEVTSSSYVCDNDDDEYKYCTDEHYNEKKCNKHKCNNGNGNGSEGCSSSDNGNDDEDDHSND